MSPKALRLVSPMNDDDDDFTPADDPAAVERLIQEWPDEFLACRSGNHHWAPSRVDDARSFWIITEVCPRCRGKRMYDVSPRDGRQFGEKRYDMPDGYAAKDVGRIGVEGRNMIRLASVLRNMPKPRKLSADAPEVLHPHIGVRRAMGQEAG